MNIHGFLTLTLLDYPGRLASVLFLGACNFRCPFCQNGNLVLSPDKEPCISEQEILAFLKKRKGILDGVCISGGEPTLYAELPGFIHKIKSLGYLIKLDTNGTNPEMLRYLHQQQLIDYVAMDIKSSLSCYAAVSGLNPDSRQTEAFLKNITESAAYLMSSGIDYEFRTTVVQELHSAADFEEISRWLAGCRRYYLQIYRESEHILASLINPNASFHACSKNQMEAFRQILLKTVPLVEVRGQD